MKAEQPKQQALDKCSIKGFVLCSNQRGSAFNGVIRDPRELGVYKKYSSKGVVTLSVRKGFVKEAGLLEPFDGSKESLDWREANGSGFELFAVLLLFRLSWSRSGLRGDRPRPAVGCLGMLCRGCTSSLAILAPNHKTQMNVFFF